MINLQKTIPMKFFTTAEVGKSRFGIDFDSRITILGSCFADNIGTRLAHAGFNVCLNPFGTLYNPLSICNAVRRLDESSPFTGNDCIMMGAGSNLICSFSHHTSFARPSIEQFLENANSRLDEASSFWKNSDTVIISLGTIYCYYRDGAVVANCLKRPATEFNRKPLSLEETSSALKGLVSGHPEKNFIFTISPIRHLSDGAHANQISKATLLLGVDSIPDAEYFPAYEIILDELRDYRFYAEDLTHPSSQAVDYIWEKFVEFAIPDGCRERIKLNEKAWRASQHRPIGYVPAAKGQGQL